MARPPATTPTLSHTPGTALHRQIFVLLREEIARGVYAASGVLPKEEALCERFSVSRITVRRALADLAHLNLIERRHGKGSYVRSDALTARVIPSLSVIDSLHKTAIETEVKVLKVEQAEPPSDIAAMLQLAPGTRATRALRLRSIAGVPVMLTEAWVPADVGRKVTAAALRKKPLYLILMDQGVRFGRVVQEITTQLADPTRAGWLQVETGSPMLKMMRLMHDQDARPVQQLTVLVTPERSRILMDIPGELVNTFSAGQFIHDVGGQPTPGR